MSEPDLTGSFSAERGQSAPLEATSLNGAALFNLQSSQGSGVGTNGTRLQGTWQQSYQSVLAELEQSQTLAQNRLERIYQLEQALDQSLASVRELKLQILDQRLLEAQLASTEEIANIQQQAIVQLKHQLTQQQQVLEIQIQETQARDQAFQDLLTATESLTEIQQAELERLRNQIAHDWAEGQTHQNRLEKQLGNLQTDFTQQQQRIVELETQVLSARTFAASLEVQLTEARSQIQALSEDVDARQAALTRVETELKQAYAALEEQQGLITRLHHHPPATPDSTLDSITVNRELAIAQSQMEDLARYQLRAGELEQQNADMQEQILKQAQQASEYEAAVQHWKDRCLVSQHHASRLQELLTPMLHKLAVENPDGIAVGEVECLLTELVKTLQSPTTASSAIVPSIQPKTTKIDLPDFLARRRRSYKAQ